MSYGATVAEFFPTWGAVIKSFLAWQCMVELTQPLWSKLHFWQTPKSKHCTNWGQIIPLASVTRPTIMAPLQM